MTLTILCKLWVLVFNPPKTSPNIVSDKVWHTTSDGVHTLACPMEDLPSFLRPGRDLEFFVTFRGVASHAVLPGCHSWCHGGVCLVSEGAEVDGLCQIAPTLIPAGGVSSEYCAVAKHCNLDFQWFSRWGWEVWNTLTTLKSCWRSNFLNRFFLWQWVLRRSSDTVKSHWRTIVFLRVL